MNGDNMCITFTDGKQRIPIELPVNATVTMGLEALREKLPGSEQEKIFLFKGSVQMDGFHQLRSYGIVHGTSVVFKKQMPVRRF